MMILSMSLGVGLASARPVFAQSTCSRPRVLVVLDKSSSMVTGTAADGQLKWDAARSAVETLVQAYGDVIDFGLMMYPNPNQCAPGQIDVDVGTSTAGDIALALTTPPPTAGNYTPMAETIDVAATYAPLLDPNQRNYVLLVTDGWQWCDPYDASTRFDAVDSVAALAAVGIDTFVLGFGAGVDVVNNNQMAQVGNTAIVGCNPDGSSASATDLCYYQTESQSELEDAFDSIAAVIVDETCDGQDNDCDGFVDNQGAGSSAPLTRNNATACGICVVECNDGAWSTCTVQGACDDNDACTTNDACTNNSCVGTPISCNDGNPCTADSCDPDSGCRNLPVADGTACSDGDPCTEADSCLAGVCTPNSTSTCGGDGGDDQGSGNGTDTGVGVDRGCGCRASGAEAPLAALVLVLLGLTSYRRRRG